MKRLAIQGLIMVAALSAITGCRARHTGGGADNGPIEQAQNGVPEPHPEPRTRGNACTASLSIPRVPAPPVPDRYLNPPAPEAGTREYWITVEPECWNIAPKPDESTLLAVAPADATFPALRYHAYTPGFGQEIPQNHQLMMAGPVIEANVGEKVVIHFRNLDSLYNRPHSMHLHGVHYDSGMDGGYSADNPDKPGAAVKYGEVFTYNYWAEADSVGVWPYHDHSVQGSNNTTLGMFGAVRIHSPDEAKFDKEFYLFMHGLDQDVTGLPRDFDVFNGRAYMGNTPHVMVSKGQIVRFNVVGFGNEFHTFHLHGYRWERNGVFEDVRLVGPATAWSIQFAANQAGMWMYHCHVEEHMLNGMMGMFMVME